MTAIDGDRFASCALNKWAGSGAYAEVTVFTSSGEPKPRPTPLRSDDSTQFIVGPDFVVRVSEAIGVPASKVHPEEIAAQVGGTLLPAS